MNKIEIRDHFIPSGYKTKVFFIDGRPLYEYMSEWRSRECTPEQSAPGWDGLSICWSDGFDFEGDARFVRFTLNQNNAIIPILICPEDFDFSCTVIVAEVEKQHGKVIWKRIGEVDHTGESFEDEKRSGILCVKEYSEEDRIRYGDNIALAEADSPEWCKWISENWSEELYRRRINYTFQYYQNEDNIRWIGTCNFEFDGQEYRELEESCCKDQ